MKTDVAKPATGEKTNLKPLEERPTIQGARRSLHPLQKAAGDKENLVGAGRFGLDMPSNAEKTLSSPSAKNVEINGVKKQKTSRNIVDSSGITVDDLTSDGAPSTSYWEHLCEKQRRALDAALDENKELHERVQLLEDENEQCRILLEETKALVETLKEMMCDDEEEEEES